MYETFYGLHERPFDLTTNPRFLFLTPRHREALSTLRYGLSAPRGLTVVLGDAGTGKTTVLRAALNEERRPENRNVLLTNPTLTRQEFYEFIARGFGLDDSCVQSKARFLTEFQRDVHERHEAGGLTTLIIDEAQSLPYELLEEVRLLANIETSTVKLLNLVLVGQPELADRLNEQSLRQLKQRITLRAQLTPLDLKETAAYVAGRLRIAGGNVSEILTKKRRRRHLRDVDRPAAHHQRARRQRAHGRLRAQEPSRSMPTSCATSAATSISASGCAAADRRGWRPLRPADGAARPAASAADAAPALSAAAPRPPGTSEPPDVGPPRKEAAAVLLSDVGPLRKIEPPSAACGHNCPPAGAPGSKMDTCHG